MARWIERETQHSQVHNQRGWDYLKKCSYSWQSPRPQHLKGDKLEQEIFKTNLPSKVKELEEENPEAEVDVWFFDEHRVSLKHILLNCNRYERLWSLVDEPLVNQHFKTIDEIENILAERCCVLTEMKDEIRNLTDYHWLTNY